MSAIATSDNETSREKENTCRPFTKQAGGNDRQRTTQQKHAPKHVGKPGCALEQPSQAVLVKGAQFRQRVVLGGLLGGRCRSNDITVFHISAVIPPL